MRSYESGAAGTTGKIAEKAVDDFFKSHGLISEKPEGRDIGIDRLVYYPGKNKVAKIQVKGRRQKSNPRWFQLTVTKKKIEEAYKSGKDLNSLWEDRIYMVDFWLLVSIPEDEIWVFPSDIIYDIAKINEKYYKGRSDNNYSTPYDKNGKITKKQKELNLNVKDENGVMLYNKYSFYLNNIDLIKEFLNNK